MKRLFTVLTMLLFFSSTLLIPTPQVNTQSINLIKNASFEEGLNNWSISTGTATYSVDDFDPVSGSYCVKGIEVNVGSLGRLYQDVTGLCIPNRKYKIGGWIKTNNVEGVIVIALNYVTSGGWTPADGYVKEIGYVTGTQDWTYFESEEFTLPSMPAGSVALWFLFDFNAGKGLAWWDEVFLISVGVPAVDIDIKPCSLPNPINVNSKGVISVAICGTEELDVTEIDPASIRLEGVAPLRWSLEDVTLDGYLDLGLHFDTQEVVAALGSVYDGAVLLLYLTGNVKEEFGGMPIEGTDVADIIKKR